MTTAGAAVSGAHIAACARDLLENSKTLLNDSRGIPVSKDDIDSIKHDVHLAFALLARRYNSQVPVNRLHPELLGMVFEHLRAPTKVVDPEDALEQSVFDLYKPLIHAMVVCQKWYVVASEKASLWTDVDYSRGRAGPTCLLNRSGTAPIHLRLILDGSTEDKAYFREVVRANASRLLQLDLCMTDTDTTHTVGQLLENDMPLLQCLKLADEYYQRNAVSTMLGRFPSLRGMMLTGFFWQPAPEAGPLTKLTHLHISTLSDIPMAAITALLDATPALEVLELHECRAVTQTELPTRTTTLQHLTHLTIRQMFTGLAEVFMPALALPRATTVCLWFEVDTQFTDAILPQPPYWHGITRIHVEEDIDGSPSIDLEGGEQRVALCLEYDPDEEWDDRDRPLWPLPVPSLLQFAHVSAAHLSFLDWELLRQFLARVPALATLVVEAGQVDTANTREMVEALRDVLLQEDPVLCPGLREVALISSKVMPGLTERLAPGLKKRKRDGRQVERLRTWIKNGDHTPETTAMDIGDALAEYVGAGVVEHEEGAFWPRDEELWRRENEFWEVPRTWSGDRAVGW